MKSVPEFARPPVVEVALSVQFDAQDGLHAGALGNLWNAFSDEYPVVEEHPALPPIEVEQDQPDQPSVDIQISAGQPPPRLWFLNKTKDLLIQAQRDRISYNWRKQSEVAEYPRFEVVRKRLEAALVKLASMVSGFGGELRPNHTELVYVDHIPVGVLPASHSDLGSLLSVWRPMPSLNGPALEEAGCSLRFPLLDSEGRRVGSIRVVVAPAFKKIDLAPIFVMTTVVRSVVPELEIPAAVASLNRSHEAAVDVFLALTEPALQGQWGRQE